MKVTQESPDTFKPVTITLETREELNLLYQLLDDTNLVLDGRTRPECESLYNLYETLYPLIRNS